MFVRFRAKLTFCRSAFELVANTMYDPLTYYNFHIRATLNEAHDDFQDLDDVGKDSYHHVGHAAPPWKSRPHTDISYVDVL